MKRPLTLVSAAFLSTALFAVPEVTSVTVKQLWPWSTNIRVDYTIAGVTDPVDVTVAAAWNGSVPLNVSGVDATLRGDWRAVSNGSHSFTIDPIAAFGTNTAEIANFRVKLATSASPVTGLDEVLYRIYDLKTFQKTDLTRRELLSGAYGTCETNFNFDIPGQKCWTGLRNVLIWTGVTNNPAYKTTKLVMRRIPAKDVTYSAGNFEDTYATKADCGSPTVTLRRDFWIGVFELTEGQYKLLTAVNGVPGTSPTSSGDDCPVAKVSYHDMRGKPEDWEGFPANRHAVTSGCALQKMRDNITGVTLDLPGEYEWEYACRAGTTNDVYLGYRTNGFNSLKAAQSYIAWTSTSATGRNPVGRLLPNAFGLYDILGNVYERCRDLTETQSIGGDIHPVNPEDSLDDPMGSTDTSCTYSIIRGGTYSQGPNYSVPNARYPIYKSNVQSETIGYRLWMTDND